MTYSPKTFKYDGILRDEKGKPVGRVVIPSWFVYKEGEDISISVLKVPLSIREGIFESEVYVDGFKYQIPRNDIKNFRANVREGDWIISSFILKRVG